jgi:hypothetical protein
MHDPLSIPPITTSYSEECMGCLLVYLEAPPSVQLNLKSRKADIVLLTSGNCPCTYCQYGLPDLVVNARNFFLKVG